jgi:Cu2+-exporting ATPase
MQSLAPPLPALQAAQRDLSIFVTPTDGGAERMDFAVEGIHCAGCMARIEGALAREPGIRSARVNLTDKRLAVTWPAGGARPDVVLDRLAALGFTGHPYRPEESKGREDQELKRLLRSLGVAAFAAMNIMLLSVSVWSGHTTGLTPETRDLFHWASALIALPAAAYAGRPFFDSAIRALKARAVNMDVPISLGILLALAMSVVETANHGEHAYFDGAIMLIFFLLLGRTLDQVMRKRTRAVATNLAALRSGSALKVFTPDEAREVPVAAIEAGDLVVVRPGDRIAIDGVIESGTSDIDQSLVTGETRPAAVGRGDTVHAGTINHTGLLRVRVRHAATGTLLDEIERLLKAATEGRSRHVALADRAARLYAPLVHATALLTFLGWLAAGLPWGPSLVIAITVLIITCPCALGLAVPAVQVVASGALFHRQVLLNRPDALERLAEIDTVVFDKTGTLTEPEARIVNLDTVPADLADLAGRLALSSRHPLARALARATGAGQPFQTVREEQGRGLLACHQGAQLRLGAPDWCGAQAEAALALARHPDASLIAFRMRDRVAVFAVAQTLRPDVAETVDRLRRMGLAVHVLSGDRPEAMSAAERAVRPDSLAAGARPGEKVAFLERLRNEGRRVLMVGDGLNDAPALAGAHVSMSPITAADLTQSAADAVFLGNRLAPVADSVALARKARRVMGENLWLAVIYNAVAVPVAIAGLATPLIAAAAMSGSSILVTLNALRARAASGVGRAS